MKKEQKKTQKAEVGPIRLGVDHKRRQKGERWYWRGRLKGGTRKVVLTGWYTRDEAMLAAAHLIETGIPDSSPSADRNARTINDLMNRWFRHQESRAMKRQEGLKSGISRATLRHYEKDARHIIGCIGQDSVFSFGKENVERYIRIRLDENAGARTLEQEIKSLGNA